MASQKELEQMKEFLMEQLGFTDKSDFEAVTDNEIEQAYNELVNEAEKSDEGPTAAFTQGSDNDNSSKHGQDADSASQASTETSATETAATGQEHKPEHPTDPVAQYQLFVERLHKMAETWVEKLGNQYIPFVESSENGFVYGAEHVSDPRKTKFSEVPIPNSLADEVTQTSSKTGPVYRWAQAKYEELYREAKQKAQDRGDDAFVYDLGEKFSIEHRSLNIVYDAVKIPQRIRQIVGE